MPIYGHSIGLSASLIGVIMGTFATAVLLTRIVMPALVRKSNEETVLFGSLSLAAGAFIMKTDARLRVRATCCDS